MATYGDLLLDDYRSTLEQLSQLTHKAYTEQEVRDLISKIGTKTELYLKAIAFPVKNPRDNFVSFINELKTVAIAQAQVDWLHDLRKLYNDAKHNPGAQVTLLSATATIRNAEKTVLVIVGKGIGNSSLVNRLNSHRVYWIAAWDHYTSGDTEVHIIIPGESEHWLGPPTFDMVNIKLLEWEDVKSKLSIAGLLSDPDGMIPKKQLESFKKDDDFLAAFVWEGEYRILLNVLAQHELRQELIGGLNRQDTGHYMQIAFLLAMLDVVTSSNSIANLESNIQTQATISYGVPKDYVHSSRITDGLVSLVKKLTVNDWANIHGPKWLTDKQWDEVDKPKAVHENGYILIDSNLSVAMKWKT
jgi:hypothetical protein